MRLMSLSLLLAFAMPALGDDVPARLAKQLRVDPKDIAPTAIAGLYKVTLGPQVLYMTADGRYALRGGCDRVRHAGRNSHAFFRLAVARSGPAIRQSDRLR